MRHISVSVTPSALRRKSVSHVADKIIVYHVGMPSVKTSTKHSCYPEGHDSSRADTALLARLDRKRRDRWSETVQNIDFSHFSGVAWSTLNNFTARSRQSPRQSPVSANAIASQLVKTRKYEGAN